MTGGGAAELLERLRSLGVRLRAEEGELRVSAPRGSLSAELREELQANKAELVRLLSTDHERIPRVPRERPLPLSFTQERLWFLSQLEPDSAAYNVWLVRALRGPLDVPALERTLAEIVRRHEILRTTLPATESGPRQEVAEPDSFRVEHRANERGLGRESWHDHVRATIEELVQEPLDLARGPLFRVLLFDLGPDDGHVLFVISHHVVFDGLSIGLFLRELAQIYPEIRAGRGSPLGEPAVQYGDYAAWQRRMLAGPELQRERAYWLERLAGELPLLELPADRPRPPVFTYRGGVCRRWLPPELVERLSRLAAREGATLFMALLAGYQALLQRMTGLQDVIVGTAVANRPRPELQELIGYFANTIALRTDLSGDPSFRALLGRVRKVALEAFDHQQMPFERLVEELAPERSLSHTPIFQTLFVLDDDRGAKLAMGDVEVDYVEFDEHVARTDLTLSAYRSQKGVLCWTEYNRDLFDPETIERLLARYEALLAGAAEDPERPLSRLPFTSDEERRRVTVEWNRTRVPYPRERSIAQIFAEQAARTPGALAVSCRGERLTYRELDRRTDQLARHLAALGVRRGTRVATCLERSPDMIVGVLAILKAGGAYVPLDPAYPKERLAFLLEDCATPVVVAHEHLVAELPPTEAAVVRMDADADEIAASDGPPPEAAVGPNDLAYVIYTSGSTGRPKGVLVPQRAVLRLVFGAEYARLSSETRILALSPLAFDASTFDLWGALLFGGACVVFPERVPTASAVKRVAEEEGVTTLFVTTALFNSIVDEAPQAFAPLRELLTGGEKISIPHVRRCLAALPELELRHVYGPTESTTFATWHPISRDPADYAETIPIGRPLQNTTAYVLDSARQPLPPGVPGELYLGGEGIALGYLNRPELTSERFVPDPFGGDAGARLYRTGDLVRWSAEGELVFLGRDDDQVKVRGHRIELGEVSAALEECEGVRECFVAVHGERSDEKRLVAYVVLEGSKSIADVRRELRESLPGYMLPSQFVALEALPLNANGKVDRRVLPAPESARELESEYEPPRDERERRLAEIWREVLRVDKVGVHDNFFELGGNSLLSTRVVARIHQAFGVDLPLRELFAAPTVAGLAQCIDAGSVAQVDGRRYDEVFDRCLIPLQPRGSRRALFLVSGAHANEDQFLRFVGALLPHMDRDQPIYGFKARGLDGVLPPHGSAEEMAADYVREMREFQSQGPYLLAGNCVGGIVAFEMAQQLRRDGQEVALLALLDTTSPMEEYRALVDQHFRFWKRERFAAHLAELWRQPAAEKLDYLAGRLRRKLRQLAPLTEAQRRRTRVERVERRYSQVLASYQPRPYEGRLTLIVNEEMQKWRPNLGWDAYAAGELETHVVPGDHVTRLSQNAGLSACLLTDCIRRALAPLEARQEPALQEA